MEWVEFITETGLICKYKIVGEDLSYDVKIKIITPLSKGFYYSALNEAGAYYSEFILPKLNKKQ